ncbi:L-lactate permease [Methanocella arvoryzae]|uniref:L-lactate permease n=1 Tax=Methanocella arvoryzae (strain DSM 22066 / NBRC 105507 / MRE50) TaxID=351160 RepID=Q0W3Q9_METAR|nr:L-lactate permease [Methanocella arvoryzae]CAJ36984.1 putative L-lactate permease [Methanocella arvoryzae MRE50]
MDIAGLIISLLPLLVVFTGIVLFKKSGSVMVIVALALTAFLAWWYFNTGLDIIYGGIVMGVLKSLGIGITVVFAMFMVFLMQVTGALNRISDAIHRVAGNKEEKALFVGMGFGSFVTALGLVTPALFPPLLVAMGFTPVAAIAIACLGYDPLCSFALLSLPITLPASAAAGMGIPITEHSFAMNISIYLPVISVLFAFAILIVVGGMEAMKRSWVPALLSGLVISLTALVLVYTQIVPLSIVGVVAGSASMLSLYLYHIAGQYLGKKEVALQETAKQPAMADGGARATGISLVKALSPWVILILLVSIASVPQIAGILKGVPGNLEVITAFANQKVDLDILSQAYTWILVASVIGIFTLGASKAQVSQALDLTVKRFFSPFMTYTMFFCIAYIMYYSGGSVIGGQFVPTSVLEANMDGIIGVALAAAFGAYYGLVAPIPGFIGCVIGGSETSSNIMFAKIQNVAVSQTIGAEKFALAFGSLAVAGGIASAITPSKIYNACAVLGESSRTESEVMKINIWVALGLTAVTCIMTFFFLKVGIGF